MLARTIVILGSLAAGCAHPKATTASQAPQSWPLSVEPNGLWWDASSRSLLLASDEQPGVYRWRDGTVSRVGALPAPTGKPGLGQLVVARDGTILVTRFGHGDSGGILYLKPDGTSGTIAGL